MVLLNSNWDPILEKFQCARTCSATDVWKKIWTREEQRSIVSWPAPPSSAITQWRTAQTIVKSGQQWMMGSSPVSFATVPPTAPVLILFGTKQDVSMRSQDSAYGAATPSFATRGTLLPCPLQLASRPRPRPRPRPRSRPRPRPLELSLVPQVSFWPL